MAVRSPEQELRFTRSGQAVVFWMAAAVSLMTAIGFFMLAFYLKDNPQLPSPLWGLVPLSLAVPFIRLALRCTRHAYIILTPLGIEIFPLFRARKHLQLVTWSEIDHAEFPTGKPLLVLHHNKDRSSGVVLTLSPLSPNNRHLLTRAIQGRLTPPS